MKQQNCGLVQFEMNLKEFERIYIAEKLKFVLGRVENIMGKGENAGNQHFLLFP